MLQSRHRVVSFVSMITVLTGDKANYDQKAWYERAVQVHSSHFIVTAILRSLSVYTKLDLIMINVVCEIKFLANKLTARY